MVLDRCALEFAAQHNFRIGDPLARGHCSTVFRDGDRVLKIPTTPDEQMVAAEIHQQLHQAGGPELLAHDAESGMQILEYIESDRNLLAESEATARKTFINLVEGVRNLNSERAQPLTNYYSTMPVGFEWLLNVPETGFLHGDLHQENILFDINRGIWRPIDPKGLRGDPAYEAVAFLRNPIEELPNRSDLLALTLERIETFHNELRLNPHRMAAWLYVDRWEEAQHEAPNGAWRKVLPLFAELVNLTK